MALDERYIIGGPLDQYFVDKDTGLPLANGTLEFYRDTSRVTPKTVYQLTGTPPDYTFTALPNPITLSAVGTIENAGNDNVVIYYFPYDDDGDVDLYYIVAKDSDGVEQWTREAWPNISEGNDATGDFTVNNELSNTQFSRVFLNDTETVTYTVSAASNQEFYFAPDWTFVISGTGTVALQRVAVAGVDGIPTNPSYVLQVTTSSGITECLLRQRFTKNSGLWAGDFLTGSFVAKNEGVGSVALDMFYDESSGLGSPLQIVGATIDTDYAEYKDSVDIPPSANTQSGTNAYIDIYISFPASAVIRLTSLQVVPTPASISVDLVAYDQQSANREQALMGDYFIPALENKPIPSLLTGWDFPLNPARLGGSGTITATPAYILDQTISEAASMNIAWQKNSITNGLQCTPSGNTEGFYLLQYLAGAEVKKMLGTRLSVNVNGFKGTVGSDVTMRVYLFRGTSGASFPTLPTSLGTIATTGVFTLTAANWAEIERNGLDTATATLATVTNNSDINSGVDYGFNSWEITDDSEIGDTDKFAIVVSFAVPDMNTVITINSISLVPGDIPTRPAPQSQEEVEAACGYYYESSYDLAVAAGTVAPSGIIALQRVRDPSGSHTLPASFFVRFASVKRTDPTVTLYSPATGTTDRVSAFVRENGSTSSATDANSNNWTLTTSIHDFGGQPATDADLVSTGGNTTPTGWINFHFTADARLGVV